MRIVIVSFLGILLSGCVTFSTDAGLARTVLDTRAGMGEAAGAHLALTTVFGESQAMTAEAKTEMDKAQTEIRYANALFYLKAVPLLTAGESQREKAVKALEDTQKRTTSAKEHLAKAEATLKEQVK